MHPGAAGDPVEEITLRIANLELTLRVRSVGPAGSSTTASTTSLGGFEVVSSGPVGAGPVRESLVSPAVEENILNASTGAALGRFTYWGGAFDHSVAWIIGRVDAQEQDLSGFSSWLDCSSSIGRRIS